LFAHAQWLANAMDLIGFAKSRGDQHRAIGLPTGEGGATRVLLARQTGCQFRRQFWQAIGDAIANFKALGGLYRSGAS